MRTYRINYFKISYMFLACDCTSHQSMKIIYFSIKHTQKLYQLLAASPALLFIYFWECVKVWNITIITLNLFGLFGTAIHCGVIEYIVWACQRKLLWQISKFGKGYIYIKSRGYRVKTYFLQYSLFWQSTITCSV